MWDDHKAILLQTEYITYINRIQDVVVWDDHKAILLQPEYTTYINRIKEIWCFNIVEG